MELQHLENDLIIAIGKTYNSNSTIVLNGDQAMLIDALASREDAEELRDFVETTLGKRVSLVICTHYFSDHLAALSLFPEAQIVAHKNYRDTFASERFRSEEEASFFVEPTILVSDDLTIRWGRFTLNVFHNPGHTASTLGVDIPEADLLIAGDTVVGNIVYLAYSTPGGLSAALDRLQLRRKGRFLTSHLGVRSSEAIDHAVHYLQTLEEKVHEARKITPHAAPIAEIDIHRCLPDGVETSPYEEIYHRRNLDVIVQRELFATM
jgi:cyclase